MNDCHAMPCRLCGSVISDLGLQTRSSSISVAKLAQPHFAHTHAHTHKLTHSQRRSHACSAAVASHFCISRMRFGSFPQTASTRCCLLRMMVVVVVGLHFTVIDYIKCVHEQRTNTHMRVFAHELLRVRVNARGNPCLRRGLFHVCTCIECRLWIALIKQSLDPAERELSTGFGYKTCTLVYMYVCLLPRVDELHGIA